MALCLRVCKNLQQTCAWWLCASSRVPQRSGTTTPSAAGLCFQLRHFLSVPCDGNINCLRTPNCKVALHRTIVGCVGRVCAHALARSSGNAQAVHWALRVGESKQMLG
eukprot:580791-Amphidinium_carterae.2